MRSFFLFALIIAAASAFVQPATKAVAFSGRTTPQAPQMIVDGSVLESAVSAVSNANLIATTSGDFGGAFFPVVGLAGIGALILFLAPPLVSND